MQKGGCCGDIIPALWAVYMHWQYNNNAFRGASSLATNEKRTGSKRFFGPARRLTRCQEVTTHGRKYTGGVVWSINMGVCVLPGNSAST